MCQPCGKGTPARSAARSAGAISQISQISPRPDGRCFVCTLTWANPIADGVISPLLSPARSSWRRLGGLRAGGVQPLELM